MQTIYDFEVTAGALATIPDTAPKRVLQQRTAALAEYGTGLACFILIEPGDTIGMIEAELNLPIANNAIDQTRYGDPDFTPSFEWIEDHGGCWEMPFIMTDDGYGHVLLIPDVEGIDPALLSLCRAYAQGKEPS